MNDQECANCAAHGWKQIEDLSQLQKCKNCKVIFYCGKECQAQHWKKVHKRQCKYFADPVKAQQLHHREENCSICLREPPMSILRKADNPNYMCTQSVFDSENDYHPHPFPAAGQPGDTLEKAIIVLGHVVFKFQLIQPDDCEELANVCALLATNRVSIWRNRKIFPRPDVRFTSNLHVNLRDMLFKIENSNKAKVDPFQWRKIIFQVHEIFAYTVFSRGLQALKDPLASIHVKFHSIVTQGVDNSPTYISVANDVLEALANQVIPYQEVLKIICGGSLNQKCSFCSKPVVISGVVLNTRNCGENCKDHPKRPEVFFDPMFVRMYSCCRKECLDKVKSMKADFRCFEMVMITTMKEREANQCDYCFQLPPTKDVHRCGGCRTMMYCSVTCKDQDWDIHKLFCKKNVEGRKIKARWSVRNEVAMESKNEVVNQLENISHPIEKSDICDIFDNLKVST